MERRRATGSSLATFCPRTVTVPDVGVTIRLTIRMSVVLPHPEVPRNTVVVCGAIVKEKSSTARVSGGYVFETVSKVIMGLSSQRNKGGA